MPRNFDAIIIGAGQSGPFLAARLAEAGWSVALAEREHLGGTCVNTGCTPTKTLVASARVAHMARRAMDFGVLTGPVSVDYAAVKARKDSVVAASRQGLEDWLGGMEKVSILRGSARFTGRNEIAVGDERCTAPKIFINAGCRAVVPDWPGLAEVPYLTSSTIMDLAVLPKHLVIVGGSYIGLEFAQIYRRLGSEVTVIEHGPRLVSREDEDTSATIRDILAAEGIRLIFNARDFRVEKTGDGIGLGFTADTPQRISGSHLLVAVGRRPNIEELGLAAAGIDTDARGYIPVDDRLETAVPGIFALGDINGRGAFTHTSYNDFEIVAANLLEAGDRKVSDRIAAHALYIDPPLGRVGMSEAEVRARGLPALVGIVPMARVGRAKERSETLGFMKVFADPGTRQILGAAILGIEGDEVIHSLLNAMAAKTPYPVVQRAMHIHPTVSEFLPVVLGALKPLE